MSGFEILGAVSAASSLFEQCGKVIKLACNIYSKYQNPNEVKKQLVQIQQVLDLAVLIKGNPSLQTTEVESILNSCLADIHTFTIRLNKIKSNVFDTRLRKLKKSITAVMQENDIKDLFANLERHKSSLSLCIGQIDSSLLHSIGIGLGKVAGNVEDIKTVVLTMNQRINPVVQPVNMTDRSYFEVPNRRVDCFVGREDVFQRLETAPPTETGSRIFVLRGLGGQGKTQIALEYCRRAREKDVQAVFWVDSNTEGSVKKSFQTIADKLKNLDSASSAEDATPFILETFRDWPKAWVMVFDNYDNIKNFDNIRDYLPASKNGIIIVTSRNSGSENLTMHQPRNFIELDGLSSNDSLELLRIQCRLEEAHVNTTAAKAIVERLACHPLAITQAGSYISKKKIRLDQFLTYYNNSRDKILKHTPQLSQYRRSLNADEQETSLNVFTTWELSLQQLLETTYPEKKKDLLTLFAFFDCKDISEELFSTYVPRAQMWPEDYHWPVDCLEFCLGEEFPEGQLLGGRDGHQKLDGLKQWDRDSFEEILSDLSEMALVQSWDRGVDEFCHCSLHPLIKDWIRLRSTIEDTNKFTLISSKVIEATLETRYHNDVFTFPLAVQQVLLSHIDEYTANINILQEAALVRLESWHGLGLDSSDEWNSVFLLQCGRYREAEVIFRRLVDFYTEAFGTRNERTFRCMNNLAATYAYQGKQSLAEDLYRKVLEGRQALLGPDHPDTLHGTRELAELLIRMGKYQEAEKYARLAAEGGECTLGIESQDTLRSLHTLGIVLTMQHKYEESEKVLKRTLEGSEKLLGPSHADTLETVEELGSLWRDMGNLDAAEKMLRRSLEGREVQLGKDHPRTLISVNNLGLIIQDLGRLDEAEEMFRRAIDGKMKVFGRQNSETLMSVWCLATVLRGQEKFTESQGLWKEALEGLKVALGEEHPSTVNCSREYDWLMEIVAANESTRTIEMTEED
ncbi:hypothetical protein VTL71DRAFT_12132 [Oculimacula yallundae]|uniref:NB-ARC domain-containing protein n=1 Tax=Oculimacula yallundae TaxID=86028 RepID=A0ABR4CS31_9HELO